MNKSVHQIILKKMDLLCDWFEKESQKSQVPFYSSYDVRDSSYKIANVDANIYPAGFNNICPADKDHIPDLMKAYLNKHYSNVHKILLVSEDNLKNAYYWENVYTIQALLMEAGYEVRVGMPGLADQDKMDLESYIGNKITVEKVLPNDGLLQLKDFHPDLVISNNDFSKLYSHWPEVLKSPMTPAKELGWYQRKKSNYFENYNAVASEFAQILELDPWLFQVDTQLFASFDVSDDQSRQHLAEVVENTLQRVDKKHKEHKVDDPPFVFVKNNAGTYGLGVIQVKSAKDVLEWTYNSRKKMKAQKGGGQFHEVIVQEGIPTVVKSGNSTAEPTIYMLGSQLAGGFLRAHDQKDEKESLNSPGAVYKRLCLSDLRINTESCPLENVYGWVAKMGVLAIGRETEQMGIKYNGYRR